MVMKITIISCAAYFLLLAASSSSAKEDGLLLSNKKSEYEKCMKSAQKAPLTECSTYMQEEFPESLLKLKYVCCKKLKKVKEECRCQAIQKMVEHMRGQIPWEAEPGAEEYSKKTEDFIKKVETLPFLCGQWPLYCQLRHGGGGGGGGSGSGSGGSGEQETGGGSVA